ncbi:MAG: YigZ family protein [Lachnospiraceae bacterium]|nr:YigZ family protein [Lachnospiraceae bacterium]
MGTVKYIHEGGVGEILEKKSRFIATVRSVSTEEEAAAFIAEMKKKYWDARHNCSAFVLGDNGELTRCSDDGEPSGTAGRPMLEVLLGSGVRNVCAVVTRYFGGVLLGTGGLVRAYSDAVNAGLNNSVIIEVREGFLCKLVIEYTDLAKLQYLFSRPPYEIRDTAYEDKVTFELAIPAEEFEAEKKKITEATGGRVVLTPCASCKFARAGEELLIFEERKLP